MTPERIAAELRAITDPVHRENVARGTVNVARLVRAEALRELQRKLGSWGKVSDVTGFTRQVVWKAATQPKKGTKA